MNEVDPSQMYRLRGIPQMAGATTYLGRYYVEETQSIELVQRLQQCDKWYLYYI